MIMMKEQTVYDTNKKCRVVRKTVMHEGNVLPSSFCHPENCDTVFRFRFPLNMVNDRYDMSYRVYTFKREDMDLFLKQHGFDSRLANVECIPIDQFEDDEDHLLKSYKFKSNTSKEIFNIMTSERFVSDTIDFTCAKLSDTLVFGPPIVRDDIEIIKLINELMYKIPHVFVLDHTLVDDVFGEPYSVNWDKYIKHYDFDQSLENMDDSYIYESMHAHSIDEYVQPITVEAYVAHFTQMIMDSCEDQ